MARSVEQLMTTQPVVVDADTQVLECARQMERREIGAVGVTREGRLIGVLTDRDIVIRAVAYDRDPRPIAAGEIASRDVVVIPAAASIEDAEQRMRERAVRRLFVVDADGTPLGIITADDLTALRYPDSVVAHQLGEWGLGYSDQGYTGQG